MAELTHTTYCDTQLYDALDLSFASVNWVGGRGPYKGVQTFKRLRLVLNMLQTVPKFLPCQVLAGVSIVFSQKFAHSAKIKIEKTRIGTNTIHVCGVDRVMGEF